MNVWMRGVYAHSYNTYICFVYTHTYTILCIPWACYIFVSVFRVTYILRTENIVLVRWKRINLNLWLFCHMQDIRLYCVFFWFKFFFESVQWKKNIPRAAHTLAHLFVYKKHVTEKKIKILMLFCVHIKQQEKNHYYTFIHL